MRPLKVAWDDSLASRDKAGTGMYAARLLENFKTRQDISLKVFGTETAKPGAGDLGKLTRGGRILTDLLWTHAYLPAKLAKLHPDLLHAPAFVAPFFAPCPVVVTVHDVTYLLYASHFSRWWRSYLKFLMPRVMKSAAAIICGSEHSRQDILSAYPIPAEKVRVIPYGVDHSRYHPGEKLDEGWATAKGIRSGYVLHVGTLSHRKDIPTLLRAVHRLRQAGKWRGRQVVLAGGAGRGIKGADAVYDALRELKLEDVVLLAGHVPDEHVAGLYASASLLVMPSLYEGFGFPILEAMASGTPVICSNTSSLPEVGGDAALYFTPQDDEALAGRMEQVLGNAALSQEMRSKGILQAGRFNWERTAAETIALYREIAKV